MALDGRRFFRWLVFRRTPLTPGRAGRAIAVSTLLVTIVCGVVIRVVDPSDFGSVWLGLWWAVQTVTTVGYGDVVPTHTFGRAVAAVLMLTGIGFLTVVTAVITATFLESARRRLGDPAQTRLEQKLDVIDARLQRLEDGFRR